MSTTIKVVVAVCAVAIASWFIISWDRTITGGRRSAEDLRRVLLEVMPPGTAVDTARAFMERNGFECDLRLWDTRPAHPGDPVLFCHKDATEYGVFGVRWWTVHYLRDGLTADVFAHRGTGL